MRRTRISGPLALLTITMLLAGCVDPATTLTPAPSTTPAAEGSLEAGRPSVALDLESADETAEVQQQLGSAGYVIAIDSPTRVTSHAPRADDEVVVEARVNSYALVVHPRAPLVDIGRDRAVSLLKGEEASGLGGPLVFAPGSRRWLSSAPPNPGIVEVGSPAEVMDAVLADPTSVGLVRVEELEPRVRALTVHLFDPYRDPPEENPLSDVRWIIGPQAHEVATALGWDAPAAPDPAGLLSTAELIPTRCVSTQVAALEDGYDAIFDGTRDLISAADVAVAQWEPALIEGEPTPCTPTFNLSTRPEAALAAASAGIDVILAAGNHLGDCWPGCGFQAAVLETLGHLRDTGLLVTGAGEDIATAREPAIIEADGVTFAFLAYDDIAFAHYGATETTAGTAHADPAGIAADVRAAAERADHVIVGFSWGVEYVTQPTERQRELAYAAAEAGASLILGNHPHAVQATEWIGDTFVAYALGNFVFDQDWSVETTQGVMLEAGFTRDRLLGVRLRPTAVRNRYSVEALDPTEGEGRAVLERIWGASDTLAESVVP